MKLKKSNKPTLFDICLDNSAALNFKKAVQICKEDPTFKAIVTAPLSKSQTAKINPSQPLGHTEIIKSELPGIPLRMGVLGRKFNVFLHSHHIPLKEGPAQITKDSIVETLQMALEFRKKLTPIHKFKPLALLGLNPHGGEGGLIGTEEMTEIKGALSHFNTDQVCGPLVPDVAFQQENWAKYSAYIALYHDQGLIPFKLIHGQSQGIQVTLGLPFIRTSVDHGTAKDIYNLDIANHESMKQAIRWALEN